MSHPANIDGSNERVQKALDLIANRVLSLSLNSNLPIPQRIRQIKLLVELWSDARVKAAIMEVQNILNSQSDSDE